MKFLSFFIGCLLFSCSSSFGQEGSIFKFENNADADSWLERKGFELQKSKSQVTYEIICERYFEKVKYYRKKGTNRFAFVSESQKRIFLINGECKNTTPFIHVVVQIGDHGLEADFVLLCFPEK